MIIKILISFVYIIACFSLFLFLGCVFFLGGFFFFWGGGLCLVSYFPETTFLFLIF